MHSLNQFPILFQSAVSVLALTHSFSRSLSLSCSQSHSRAPSYSHPISIAFLPSSLNPSPESSVLLLLLLPSVFPPRLLSPVSSLLSHMSCHLFHFHHSPLLPQLSALRSPLSLISIPSIHLPLSSIICPLSIYLSPLSSLPRKAGIIGNSRGRGGRT